MLYIKVSLYLGVCLLKRRIARRLKSDRRRAWIPKDVLQMIWKRDKIKKNMGIEKLTVSSGNRDRFKAGMAEKMVSRKISVAKSPGFSSEG